jgi:hypothetical protein
MPGVFERPMPELARDTRCPATFLSAMCLPLGTLIPFAKQVECIRRRSDGEKDGTLTAAPCAAVAVGPSGP